MRKKTVRLVGRLAVAAIVCGLLVSLLSPPERNLFHRAKMIEPREDFVYPPIAGRFAGPLRLQCDWPYCWVTNRLLLTVRFGENSILTIRPELSDLASGSHMPLSRLAALAELQMDHFAFAGVRPQRIETFFTCLASPDGRWIFAPHCAVTDTAGKPACVAVRADGSEQVEWPIPAAPVSAVWLRDGRRCAGLTSDAQGLSLCVFDLSRPGDSTVHKVDTLSRVEWGGTGETAPTLAGALPDGRILAVNWSLAVDGTVPAARISADDRAMRPEQFRIPVPAAETAIPRVPPALSPSGTRLAWFVSLTRTPAGWPGTSRFWSLWRIAPINQIALWTTRPDGSDAREVAAYTQRNVNDVPSQLEWTPDGHNLSFRHEGALYIVSGE